MDVPVLSGLSLASTKSSSMDPVVVDDGSSANERKFSDHLDENVDRLANKKKQETVDKPGLKTVAEPPNKEVANPDNAATGNNVRLDQAAEKVQSLPQGLQNLLVKEGSPEQAEGVFTAVNVIANKRELDVVAEISHDSGKELPLAEAEIDALLLSDDLALPIEISFDPLTQANESSAHMAALVTGGVVEQKTQAPTVSNRVDPLAAGLLTDEPYLQSPVVLLNKAVETINTGFTAPTQGNGVLPTDGVVNTLATQTQSLTSGGIVEKATVSLETPMGHPRWSQDFNQRVQWMVNQSVSGAQIRLNPQHMGPVEVRIQLQNDQVSISFTAQHGATREAIDAALPRLREMLSDQNVNIVDVDVSQHSFAEQREQQASSNENTVATEDSSEQEESIFEQSEGGSQRIYNGLFSGVA